MEKQIIEAESLSHLIETKYSTIVNWWTKGFAQKPRSSGGSHQAAVFTKGEALSIAIFHQIISEPWNGKKRKLPEAAVTSRYFQKRPGFYEVLKRNWTEPINLTVYPLLDIAFFNKPEAFSMTYDYPPVTEEKKLQKAYAIFQQYKQTDFDKEDLKINEVPIDKVSKVILEEAWAGQFIKKVIEENPFIDHTRKPEEKVFIVTGIEKLMQKIEKLPKPKENK